MHSIRSEQFTRSSNFETYDPELDNDSEMPNRLYWRPICDNDEAIDNQLKYILMEQDIVGNNILTTKELGLLKGIRAAASFLNQKELESSTTKLIEAIETFGTLQLFSKEEY